MRLIDWLKRQDDTESKKKELSDVLGKSDSAVTAYIYGYRRVPSDVASKIVEFTEGEVTAGDIKEQYITYNDKKGSFAFSSLKGQRLGRPIVSVCKSSTQDEKQSFMAAIANEIALEVGA